MGAKRHPRACLHCNKIHYSFEDAYLMFPHLYYGEAIWLLLCSECLVHIYATTGKGAWDYLQNEHPDLYASIQTEWYENN